MNSELLNSVINQLKGFIVPISSHLLHNPSYAVIMVGAIIGFFAILILTGRKKDETPYYINNVLNAYIRVGNFISASEILRKYGFYDTAIKMLQDANLRYLEAQTRLESGDDTGAGEILESLGIYKEAAKIYINRGKHKNAITLLKEYGDFGRAGVYAEEIKDFFTASGCYEEIELYGSTGDAYLKVSNFEKGAESYEKCWERIKRKNPGGSSYAQGSYFAIKAAECYEKSNNIRRAAEIYSFLNEYHKAATLAEKTGDYVSAARLYFKAGKIKEAERVSQLINIKTPEISQLTAEIYLKNRNFSLAGSLFAESGNYKKAAECYEKAGEKLTAADMYIKCGDNNKAYELYKEMGEHGKVAEILEKRGKYEEAAEYYSLAGNILKQASCFVKAGKLVKAADILYEQGLYDRALSLFQKITPESPEYASALEKIAKILLTKGMRTIAKEKLENFLKSADVNEETVNIFYTLAEIYEEENQIQKAMEVYKTIVSSGTKTEKAYSRIEELKRLSEQITTPPSATRKPSDTTSTLEMTRTEDFKKKYQVIEEVGRGGMGVVYKAKDLFLDRLVALKILPSAFRQDEKAQRRMIKEAKAAAKLNHPNIVTVYEAGFLENTLYIAMEYVDGLTLNKLAESTGGKINSKMAMFIFGQVAKALSYAHSEGIVHGDVKPGNIMWTKNKIVKITDFGLAKALKDIKGGVTTIVGGTPLYMSPEQVLGTGMDERSDIYALGISFYEIITGKPPFTEGDVGYHHVHTEPAPPRTIEPSIPPQLEAFILKCIKKKPEDRYQSMEEVFENLRKITKSLKS